MATLLKSEIWLTRAELRDWMLKIAGHHQRYNGHFIEIEISMLKTVIKNHYPASLFYRGKPVSVPRSLRRYLGRVIGVRDTARVARALADRKGVQVISGGAFYKSPPI